MVVRDTDGQTVDGVSVRNCAGGKRMEENCSDVAIPSYGGKRKKEHENLDKEQGVTV